MFLLFLAGAAGRHASLFAFPQQKIIRFNPRQFVVEKKRSRVPVHTQKNLFAVGAFIAERAFREALLNFFSVPAFPRDFHSRVLSPFQGWWISFFYPGLAPWANSVAPLAL